MKTVILLMFGCAALVAATSAITLPAGSAARPVQAQAQPFLPSPEPFTDAFEKVSPALWSVSDGWRNGTWTINDWRRSQVTAGDGLLISLDRNKTSLADFSGGELQTRQKYGHGYYAIRMRAAPASGTVTGFFTYTGPPFGDPWDEIDVEILGAKPNQALLTYYRDGEKISHLHKLGFDATAATHSYGFDWQQGYIRWYVDGALVHEAVGDALPLPQTKQKLMVSLWGSRELESWVGPFDPADLPTTMKIECISFAPSYKERNECQ